MNICYSMLKHQGGTIMREFYSEPDVEIRKYSVTGLLTASDPENNEDNGLNTDDNYDYFG